MTDSVDCLLDEARGLWISRSHPTRATKECLAGWACYEAVPSEPGFRIGITDQLGAYQWLNGETPHTMRKVLEPSEEQS